MFTIYIFVFSIIFGLGLTKPVEKKVINENISQDKSMEQAFRQAEITLNRYYYLMKSDTDHLVHGMLHVIMNNPTSSPYVPSRALDIALKNLEKKLGQDDVDILTKPILLSIEQNARNKSKENSTFKLTDEVKEKIEDALDKFFEEQENTSHM
jgi:L-lactate utilization protein LutC